MAGTCGSDDAPDVRTHLLNHPQTCASRNQHPSVTPIVSSDLQARVRTRRLIAFALLGLLLCLDLLATGLLGGGERVLAVVRTLVLPGLPFLEWQPWIGITCITAALMSVGAWLRWGMDWLLMLVAVVCLLMAIFVMPLHHEPPGAHGHLTRAAHEFTIVLVVFALLAQLRLLIARLPGGDWLRARMPESWSFPAVDIARASAIEVLGGQDRDEVTRQLQDDRLFERARRINTLARFRRHGDPLTGAHAPLRAALLLCGELGEDRTSKLMDESQFSLTGVPDSEPTWIRPLDGMLAAIALDRLGEVTAATRWQWIWATRFSLRHGRRPSALHRPSMLSIGTASTWEHATASALAYQMGWFNAEDWHHLRPRCLAAAASTRSDPATQRTVAAGRLWARLTGDSEAIEILERRTRCDDPIAEALRHMTDSNTTPLSH